jgi:hypothetical protein
MNRWNTAVEEQERPPMITLPAYREKFGIPA